MNDEPITQESALDTFDGGGTVLRGGPPSSQDTILLTTGGMRMTDRTLHSGLGLSTLAGALGMVWASTALGMPLTMFMEALGASGLVIGLLSSILQFSMAVQVPASFIAEHMSSRKPFWGVLALASRVVWFLPVLLLMLLPGRNSAIAGATVAILAISSILSSCVTASWYSWMADLVPDRMRGRFWGRRQSWTMAAYVVSVPIAAYLLDVFPAPRPGASPGIGSWTGFGLVFLIGAAFGCADILLHLFVPEPRPKLTQSSVGWIDRILMPLRNADFRRLTIAMGIYTFASNLLNLGIVYLKRDFHADYADLSAIIVTVSIGTIISGFLWGYVLDRIGGRAFGAIMFITAPLVMVVWFFVKDYQTSFVGLFENVPWLGHVVRSLVDILPTSWQGFLTVWTMPQPIWLLAMVNFFAGALYGGVGLSQLSLSSALAPRVGRTMAMAVHWSVVGIIGSLGGVVAGWTMDYVNGHPIAYSLPNGTPVAFHHVLVVVHVAIIWFVVLPIILRIRKRRGEPPVTAALSMLFAVNPVRLVSNINLMTAGTSRRSARAVHMLGEKRVSIAAADLVERLDDASLPVREEAAYALGCIGSPDAVDGLARKMEDPFTDIAPLIAKALGQTHDDRAVDSLLRKVGDSDRETRVECVRALGEIADRRAVPPLLQLLSVADDPRIVTACSTALARMGELEAVYKILPRMFMTGNPMIKKSLAVAVGDLLGEPDGFYMAMAKENRSRGSEVDHLIREFIRDIRRATRRRKDDGRMLMDRAVTIQSLYEDGRNGPCAAALYETALAVAELRWQTKFDAGSKDVAQKLRAHDQQFAACTWYLDQLRAYWKKPDELRRDRTEILLGIYVLVSAALPES